LEGSRYCREAPARSNAALWSGLCLSSLSLQQRGGRGSWSLAGPAVSSVQVSGPTACCWLCRRKGEGGCLPSLRAGDGKCTWKCHIKTLTVCLVSFCLRWIYASGGLAFSVAWPLRSPFLSFNVATILCSYHKTCISGNCEYCKGIWH